MTTPKAPLFQRLDGRVAVPNMTVDDRTPTVRMSSDEAIDRYEWQLWQDDIKVDSATNATTGIAVDGLCFVFTPVFALRRGKPSTDAPDPDPVGYFWPPFKRGLRYNSRTYPGHSAWSVDFNGETSSGGWRSDQGDPILAAQSGYVSYVKKSDGVVYIDHFDRLWRTEYRHMQDIIVEPGDKVQRGQRIGSLGDVAGSGSSTGAHLHMVLYKRAAHNKPFTRTRLKLQGVFMRASLSEEAANRLSGTIFGQDVVGPPLPTGGVVESKPYLRVRARRLSDSQWSDWRKLSFFISETGTEFEDVVDPGCGAGPDLPPGGVTIDALYTGPDLPPGEYSVRYRAKDDLGAWSDWVQDDTLEVTVGVPGVLDLDHSARPAEKDVRVRIILLDLLQPTHDDDATQMADPTPGDGSEYSRGPGTIRAIISDAQNIGVSEYASSPGEMFFTLPLNHPQLSECLPYQRHYRVEQWKRGEWVTRSEGLLHDVNISTNDVIVSGWDYLGLLALSVEGATQPDSEENIDAPLHRDDDEVDGDGHPLPAGSKYIEVDIAKPKGPEAAVAADPLDRGIIDDQITRAIEEPDSPVGWIELGEVQAMPEPTTIYSAFVQRLDFIRGLIDAYQQGTGSRSRIVARRDRADGDRMKFDVLADSGVDRPELRLEYGSSLQGFEIITFGDFATKVYGVGHRSLNVKPLYVQKTAPGMDEQVWGSIAKTALWQDVADTSDLTRRVLQQVADVSRIGKRVALAIRVRGLDVKDRWDITDSIPLAVDRGPVTTRFWFPDTEDANMVLSWWTIWGYEWRVSPDGHDELVLVVRPRVDSSVPLPDTANHPLLSFVGQHTTEDWRVGEVPDPPPPDPEDDLILGVDTATQYQPLSKLQMRDVKEEGAVFAVTKLTQGVYFSYPDGVTRITNSQSRGLIAGAYHFLTRVDDANGTPVEWNDGATQCDFFVSKLPNGSPEGLICMVDWESNPNAASFNRNGKTWKPNENGANWFIFRDFVNRWFTLFPRHPLFAYSTRSFMNARRGGRNVKELNSRLYLWEALYVDHTPKWGNLWTDAKIAEFEDEVQTTFGRKPLLAGNGFAGFNKAIIWQPGGFGVHGYLLPNGNPDKIDGNIFRGSTAQLLTYTVSAPEDDPDPVDDPESYRLGWNDVIDAVVAAVPDLGSGVGNAFYEDGQADARAAAITAASALRLADPT